jgi:hypothetical protein
MVDPSARAGTVIRLLPVGSRAVKVEPRQGSTPKSPRGAACIGMKSPATPFFAGIPWPDSELQGSSREEARKLGQFSGSSKGITKLVTHYGGQYGSSTPSSHGDGKRARASVCPGAHYQPGGESPSQRSARAIDGANDGSDLHGAG